MEKRGVDTKEPGGSSPQKMSDAAIRMHRAVSSAALGPNSHGELDAAARALVTELRRANHPPEKVLVQIKEILAEAGVRATQGPADPPFAIEQHPALYRTVIESSIRYYFHGDSSGDLSGA